MALCVSWSKPIVTIRIHTLTERTLHHSVYVIELPLAVAEDRKFLKQNPHYVTGQTCLYVGMTGKTPEERYQQHASGHKKAARPFKKYGVVALRKDLYEGINPLTYEDACSLEIKHADSLKCKGYGVWQN